MLVSVILPTFNRAHVLHRAIDSVLSQQVGDLELIVVDDASHDETPSVLNSIVDNRLRIVRLPVRSGAGAARNAGVAHAEAAWLAFQDSDDEWLPGHAEALLSARGVGEPVGVVYSDMWIVRDGKRRYFAAPRIASRRRLDLARALAFGVLGMGIQSALVRRADFESVGGFDESLPAFEDFELFARLSARCSFRHLGRPTVLYRPQEDGLSLDHRLVAAALEAILRKHEHVLRTRRRYVASYLLQIGRRYAGCGEWSRSREELVKAFRTAPLSVAGTRAAWHLVSDVVRRCLYPGALGFFGRVVGISEVRRQAEPRVPQR